MTKYDDKFFKYTNIGAIRSAQQVLPAILQQLPVKSVLDVGCGQGAWLSVWCEQGIEDVVGIDGEYVDTQRLLIPAEQFVSADLSKSFHVGRTFDLVQCLEVAEHLPASRAKGFIADIVEHGDIVLFSAAPKGQGGEHHVNEQDYDYWRSLFSLNGYEVLDCIRPAITGINSVEPWYRYNTFMYVDKNRLPGLPRSLQSTHVPYDINLQDISPLLYRIRKSIVRLIPVSLATSIAKQKAAIVARGWKSHG
jgi:SAM-dependent methyltransferase